MQNYSPPLLSFYLQKPNPLEKLRGFVTEIKEKGFGQNLELSGSSSTLPSLSPSQIKKEVTVELGGGKKREEGKLLS